jgi:hypothetical protein
MSNVMTPYTSVEEEKVHFCRQFVLSRKENPISSARKFVAKVYSHVNGCVNKQYIYIWAADTYIK